MPTIAEEFTQILYDFVHETGEPVVLQRYSHGVVALQTNLTAYVRAYTAAELAEGTGIIQGDAVAVLSQLDMDRQGWTGGDLRRDDKLIWRGQPRNVLTPNPRPMRVGWDVHIRG